MRSTATGIDRRWNVVEADIEHLVMMPDSKLRGIQR
jgi:hypothetical protein